MQEKRAGGHRRERRERERCELDEDGIEGKGKRRNMDEKYGRKLMGNLMKGN